MAEQLLALEAALTARGFPPMSPWWQETLTKFYRSSKRQLVLRCGRRAGKALALDTPIPTPSGWTTMGEIRVGDALFGPDGSERLVVAATDVMIGRPCYEVHFSDGNTIVADAEHLWMTTTKLGRKRAARGSDDVVGILTTEEMAKTVKYDTYEFNHQIPNSDPIDGREASLPIDPYVLGAWLGDGTSTSGGFTSADPDIVQRILSLGYDIRQSNNSVKPEQHFYIRGLYQRLRGLGLIYRKEGFKHIPRQYLRASLNQRLELLRGLMDTDGTVARRSGECQFDNTNPALTEDVCELLHSLGIKVSVATKVARLYGRDISKSWRLSFKTDLSVFHLHRKLVLVKPIRRHCRARSVVAVTPVPSVPVRCIQVSADDGMFLAGRGMIPTHNSTTITRVAIIEALYGEHHIPPGDTGIVGFLSVDLQEARQRIKLIKDILDVLGVEYRDTKESIRLIDRPIRFQVFAASFKAVVGGTWICAVCDEVARWRDHETSANPAFEVLASLRPTMATMPNAHMFLLSSPLGMTDAHAMAFDQGDTDHQMVAFAPTWVANPIISEAATRADEPNERVWKREYAAIPQGALTSVFALDDIDACINLGEDIRVESAAQAIMCIDPSRGHDAWTYCIARWIWFDGRARLRVEEIGQVPNANDTRKAVDWLTTKAKANGCVAVASDQYDAAGLAVLFSEQGLSFYQNTWSAKTKKEAVDRMDRLLRDTDIALPDNEQMRRHLVEYSEKIGRGGGDPTYSGRGKHDDYAAVLLTLIMMELQARLPLVSGPEDPVPHTVQIEEAWKATLLRRIRDRRIDQRDWGGNYWESLNNEMEYLP